jgi:type II secretory pathway pseudopilin PulG
VTLVSLLLVGGVAGLLLFNTSMQQASFTATDLEQKVALLDAQEQSLQMQLESLRDPQRVAVAAKEMGMVPPSSPAFLRLSDGSVLGKPAPATTADSIRVTPLPTRKPRNLRPRPVVIELPAGAEAGTDGAATDSPGAATDTKKAHVRGSQGSQR